jgi:hypothetical protein
MRCALTQPVAEHKIKYLLMPRSARLRDVVVSRLTAFELVSADYGTAE